MIRRMGEVNILLGVVQFMMGIGLKIKEMDMGENNGQMGQFLKAITLIIRKMGLENSNGPMEIFM